MSEHKTLNFDSAEAVIEAFGGVHAMATALGVPASTVQGWKERGAIPKSRHNGLVSAFEKLGQDSPIPVDHAIDAAASMVDKTPFEADKETRNYQPPRSAGTRPHPREGSNNLVLSLILVALVGILSLLIYQFMQRVRGNDLAALRRDMDTRFMALEAQGEALDQRGALLSGDVAALDSKIDTIATTADALLGLNERIAATTEQVEAISSQLGKLAADVQSRSVAQAQTISDLSLAQTALFESLSQDMVSQMNGIAANLDQSVTDQMARLEDRASAAREEAKRQQDIALAGEQKAREAAAQARAAEAAMAAGIRDVAAVTQLRLALAEDAPFASAFAALGDLADSSADIAVAQGALAEYISGAFADEGMPTLVNILGQIETLREFDQQAIREAAGFGAATIPSIDDETQNQGKLAAAAKALRSNDLMTAQSLILALEGQVADESKAVLLALEARQAAQTAKAALDRWIALQADGN